MADAVADAAVNLKSTLDKMIGNITISEAFARVYSPVIFNQNWSRVGRLLFMVFGSVFGSVFNIFFVSFFFYQKHLRHFGDLFLTCAGYADLWITAAVMPISATVLLSGQWDNLLVCRVLQTFGTTSTYGYNMFFAFVAIENFCKICLTITRYERVLHLGLESISHLICVLSIGLGIAGVVFGLDYDYCERKHYGNAYYRVVTTVIFHAMPAISTTSLFILTIIKMQGLARASARIRRSAMFRCEYSMLTMNAAAYFIFLAAWLPYVVIVHEYPDTSDAIYYNAVAFGLFRAVFVSSLYGIFHRCHRLAYGNFFQHCCSRDTVSEQRTRRCRRRNYARPVGTVVIRTRYGVYDPNQQSGFEETQNL